MSGSGFFRLTDSALRTLREQWERLACRYTDVKPDIENAFEMLARRYSEKGRFYHNLTHVAALLDLSESVRELIDDLDAVSFGSGTTTRSTTPGRTTMKSGAPR